MSNKNTRANQDYAEQSISHQLALLAEQVATLTDSLGAGGDEQMAAEFCFDSSLFEVAIRAIESINNDIKNEVEHSSPFWVHQRGEISDSSFHAQATHDRQRATSYITDPLENY